MCFVNFSFRGYEKESISVDSKTMNELLMLLSVFEATIVFRTNVLQKEVVFLLFCSNKVAKSYFVTFTCGQSLWRQQHTSKNSMNLGHNNVDKKIHLGFCFDCSISLLVIVAAVK